MDFKVIWSEAAIADLSGICNYIARHGAAAAQRIGNGILSHTELLASFPFIGPAYSRKSSGTLREIVFRTYRIFYQVTEPEALVEILHVRHGAREEPSGFGARLNPPITEHSVFPNSRHEHPHSPPRPRIHQLRHGRTRPRRR